MVPMTAGPNNVNGGQDFMSNDRTRMAADGDRRARTGMLARLMAYADRASLANRRMGGCPCTLPAALGFALFPKSRLCKAPPRDSGRKDDDLFGASRPGYLA